MKNQSQKLGICWDKSYLCSMNKSKMNHKPVTQLKAVFNSEEKAIKYYENLRWGDAPKCPHCKAEKPYTTNRGYKCSNNKCYKKFTVKTGTIFENSKIPMNIWLEAINLVTLNKRGVSAYFLADFFQIQEKTAWFMLHRIREMLKNQTPELLGGGGNDNNTEVYKIEVDETYIGGKSKNKHTKKKRSKENPDLLNDGKPFKDKLIVAMAIERDGKVIAKVVKDRTENSLIPFVKTYIHKGSTVYTDKLNSYNSLSEHYTHQSIDHSAKVYKDGDICTNMAETFFSHLKKTLGATHQQVSAKHLQRYVDAFTARYNNRNLPKLEAFESYLKNAEGGILLKNLKYGLPPEKSFSRHDF